MNAAVGPPVTHGSTGPRMRGRAWGALRREWIKLLYQRRSYLIWGGAVAIPFLIALALYLAGADPHGGEGPLFFQQVTRNGMFVALAALSALLPFLLPMAAAMVAGYMIAGEAELGTLRIVLLRPVRRGSFILTKWVMAMVYLAVGFGLMLAAGLLFGGIFFGLDPMITLSGTTVSVWHGLGLIVLCCLMQWGPRHVVTSVDAGPFLQASSDGLYVRALHRSEQFKLQGTPLGGQLAHLLPAHRSRPLDVPCLVRLLLLRDFFCSSQNRGDQDPQDDHRCRYHQLKQRVTSLDPYPTSLTLLRTTSVEVKQGKRRTYERQQQGQHNQAVHK